MKRPNTAIFNGATPGHIHFGRSLFPPIEGKTGADGPANLCRSYPFVNYFLRRTL